MSSELSILDCKICCSHFNNEEHRPVSGICGHSICFSCSVNLQMGTCPFCKLSSSFYKASPNYIIIEMLAHRLPSIAHSQTAVYQAIAEERQELIEDLNDYIDRLMEHINIQQEKIKELRQRNQEVTGYARQLEDKVAEQEEEIYRRSLFPESIYDTIQLPSRK